MKKLLLLMFVVTVNFSFGQQLYDYYRGYESGFAKGCGCSNKAPNQSKMYYKSGTYADGYNAGYTDGRIFLNQNTPSNSEDNLYTPDFNLIQQAMAQKQNLLNQRRQTLQSEYDNICEIVALIISKREVKTATEAEKKYFLDFKALLNKYANYDLTNNVTYNQILDWLREQKTYFMTW